MIALSWVIGIIGVYLLGYKNHCESADRFMLSLETEAWEENFYRTEAVVRRLHSGGCVFGGGK